MRHVQAEDVVPSTAVESGRVLLELVEDLLHLERGGKGLDQDGSSDRSLRQAELASREAEDVVPQSSLEVVLHLGEVEVGARAPLDELGGVVVEVDGKVEQTARDGLAVDQDVTLLQVPSSGSVLSLRGG